MERKVIGRNCGSILWLLGGRNAEDGDRREKQPIIRGKPVGRGGKETEKGKEKERSERNGREGDSKRGKN